MSSPHPEPENAAPAVPLSRPRSASAAESGCAGGGGGTSGVSDLNRVSREASGEEPSLTLLPQQPSLHSSGDATRLPAPGESHGSASADDKKSRGYSSSQRSPGPSLLTKALATARGIPNQQAPPTQVSTSNQDTSTGASRPSRTPLDTPAATPLERGSTASASTSDKVKAAQAQHGDKMPLEPRPRPPSPSSMAAWTATPATVPVPGRDATSVPSSFNQPTFTHVRDMLLEHRGASDRTLRRSSTSLDIERKAASTFEKARAFSYSTSPDTSTTPTNTSYLASDTPLTAPQMMSEAASDARQRYRPPPPEYRHTSEITEKIWSIGSGEGSEEDGLVEKSVAEAMAGVEHNARSRKSSYSLRFFKEGLPPEDKQRRRDTKSGTREKLPSTVEEEHQPQKTPTEDGRAPADSGELPKAKSEGGQSPRRTSPRATALVAEPEIDHFGLDNGDATNQKKLPLRTPPWQSAGHEETKQQPVCHSPKRQVGPSPAAETPSVEGRRESGDSTEVGDHDDLDADESGEEKISSAVFVPHQELSESRAHARETVNLVGGPGQRPRSLSQDEAHPWLVKADEPEPEIDDEKEEHGGSLHRYRSRESLVSSRGELVSELSEDLAVEGDHETSSHLAQALSLTDAPHIEDHAHDHQHHIRQPLDAIELIPYKHQVGGHTTLWRFSRRAVCKQLNNRENEFYETIERYHRDLLSFLPRYALMSPTAHRIA